MIEMLMESEIMLNYSFIHTTTVDGVNQMAHVLARPTLDSILYIRVKYVPSDKVEVVRVFGPDHNPNQLRCQP